MKCNILPKRVVEMPDGGLIRPNPFVSSNLEGRHVSVGWQATFSRVSG